MQPAGEANIDVCQLEKLKSKWPVGETNIDISLLVASNGTSLLKLKIGQVVKTIKVMRPLVDNLD